MRRNGSTPHFVLSTPPARLFPGFARDPNHEPDLDLENRNAPDELKSLRPSGHGIAPLVEAVQGSAPITALLPTFTQGDWTIDAKKSRTFHYRLIVHAGAPDAAQLKSEFNHFSATAFDPDALPAK